MQSNLARAALLGLVALGAMAPRGAFADCVLTCPADIRTNVASNGESPPISYTVIGNADCQEIIQTQGLPSGSSFPIGTTTNAFEDGGSEANCSFAVTVINRPGAPALGTLGLSALAALLGGLGFWSARRRSPVPAAQRSR